MVSPHKEDKTSYNSSNKAQNPGQDFGGIELVWNNKKTALGLLKKTLPRTLKKVDDLCFGDNQARTSNFIIEGDCLQVMASLHKYKGTIDLIYADPPYNTGSKDFRYNDNWLKDPNDSDMGEIVKDDDGSKHTKWLSFMTPRLYMMQSLLKPSGVIAVSIDDRELYRLGMLMDSIFGEQNRLGIINWQKKYAPSNDSTHLSPATEYVLVYANNSNTATTGLLARTEEMDSKYKNPDNDPEGLWGSDNPTAKTYSEKADFGIQSPFTGEIHYPGGTNCWRYKKVDMKKWLEKWGVEYIELKDPAVPSPSLVIKGTKLEQGKLITPDRVLEDARKHAEKVKSNVWPILYFMKKNCEGRPRIKRYLNNVKQGRVPMTFWLEEDYLMPEILGSQSWRHSESGHNDAAKKLLTQVVGSTHNFDTPKPLLLLEKIIQLWCPPEGIVLDPFAGSGTTAHAVLSINKKASTCRKFILIEAGNPKEKDLFTRTLTAERVKRVISGKWEKPQKDTVPLGGGFTYLRANGKVDRNAILGMEREELIDLICHADWDRNRKNISWLEKIPSKDFSYLIARNKKDQGICLIWNGKDKDATVTSDVYARARKEVEQAKLKYPFRIYGKSCTYEIDDMVFLQIPDELLRELGLEDSIEG